MLGLVRPAPLDPAQRAGSSLRAAASLVPRSARDTVPARPCKLPARTTPRRCREPIPSVPVPIWSGTNLVTRSYAITVGIEAHCGILLL